MLENVNAAPEHKADGEFMQVAGAEPLEKSLPSLRYAAPEHKANREIVPTTSKKAIVSKSQKKAKRRLIEQLVAEFDSLEQLN